MAASIRLRSEYDQYVTKFNVDLHKKGEQVIGQLLINFRDLISDEEHIFAGAYEDRLVAIKYIETPDSSRSIEIESELNAASLTHPNILPLLAVYRVNDGFLFVTPLLLTDLEYLISEISYEIDDPSEDEEVSYVNVYPSYKESGKPRLLTYQAVERIFNDMWKAIQYIHRNRVAHRDIKPANFFVNHDGGVYLADFGLSESWHSDTPPICDFPGGSTLTMSPELYNSEPHVIITPDIWALGVSLFYLLESYFPFNYYDDIDTELIPAINNDQPTYLHRDESVLTKLALVLMEKDWRKRITIDQVANYLS